MNCNGVKEHLVDFLYEEMPPDVRAAFAEHVRGCAACKAEVASYRHTLGSARAALTGPLATEPPARVHDAVMKAATAAATKAAQPATKAPNARKVDSSEPGFFAKLLRTPWLLPAFGAASVATVVFLVRVLKDPEVIPGQRATPIEERALPVTERPALAPARAARPQRESEEAAESATAETTGVRGRSAVKAKSEPAMIRNRKTLADDPLAGLGLEERAREEEVAAAQEPPRDKKLDGAGVGRRGSHGTAAGSASRFAEPPPPRRAPGGAAEGFRPETKQESSRAGGTAKDEARSNVAAKKASRDLDILRGDLDRPMSSPASATQKALAATPEPAEPAAAAAPPTPAPSPVAAPAAAPLPTSPTASSVSAASGPPSRGWAPAPPPVAASASMPPGQAKPAQAAKRSVDKAAQAESEADDAADAKMAKGQPGPSLDESIRKADRLFADQSWSAAAEAYRDLVRRFPAHKDVAKWRARTEQALVAEGEGRKTGVKAARAKSADDAAAAAAKQ